MSQTPDPKAISGWQQIASHLQQPAPAPAAAPTASTTTKLTGIYAPAAPKPRTPRANGSQSSAKPASKPAAPAAKPKPKPPQPKVSFGMLGSMLSSPAEAAPAPAASDRPATAPTQAVKEPGRADYRTLWGSSPTNESKVNE